MFKKVMRNRYVDWRWLIVWIAIYASFLILDAFSQNSLGATLIRFVGSFLLVVYVYQKFRPDTLLILALLFTFVADVFLIWPTCQIPGVYTLCFALFLHIARFTKIKLTTFVGLLLVVALLSAASIVLGVPTIYAITPIYATALISNLILAFLWYRRDRHNFHARCAFYGFVLFVACDICVGLRFLAMENVLSTAIIPLVSYLVWLFYYPSQVLIANSSNVTVHKNKTNVLS